MDYEIPDYQTAPLLTQVLTSNFLLLYSQSLENVPMSVIFMSSQKDSIFQL
jgi:hypothetical protein